MASMFADGAEPKSNAAVPAPRVECAAQELSTSVADGVFGLGVGPVDVLREKSPALVLRLPTSETAEGP
jgi:hypothetical protein